MGEAFQQRYHYNIVLRLESRLEGQQKVAKSFQREQGYRFASTPAAAATSVESTYRSKSGKNQETGRYVEYFIDQIVLRLSSERGQVVLQTERDDLTDLLALKPLSKAIADASTNAPVYKRPTTTHETNFDVYKFLTQKWNTFPANRVTFNSGVHLK